MPARHVKPRRRRIDHLPLYICVVLAQVVVAIVILSQGVYTTVFYWMSLLVETVAASALLLGGLGCLAGALSGTRWFRPNADVRDAYTVAAWSLVLVVLSMGLFEVGIIRSSHLRSETGMLLVLMTAVIAGLIGKAFDFHRETRRLSDDLVRAVTEEASGDGR